MKYLLLFLFLLTACAVPLSDKEQQYQNNVIQWSTRIETALNTLESIANNQYVSEQQRRDAERMLGDVYAEMKVTTPPDKYRGFHTQYTLAVDSMIQSMTYFYNGDITTATQFMQSANNELAFAKTLYPH